MVTCAGHSVRTVLRVSEAGSRINKCGVFCALRSIYLGETKFRYKCLGMADKICYRDNSGFICIINARWRRRADKVAMTTA